MFCSNMKNGNKKFKIIGVGELLWDIYHHAKYIGGSPANFAIDSCQLGDHAAVVSRVGNDGMGAELQRSLNARGVETKYIQIDIKNGTGTVLIQIGVDGEPAYRCSANAAFDHLQFNAALARLAHEADVVFFSSVAQRKQQARDTIAAIVQNASCLRVYDVKAAAISNNLRQILQQSLPHTDILRMTQADLDLIQKGFQKQGDPPVEFVQALLREFGIKYAAITNGAADAVLLTPQRVYTAPAYPVKVVDATGAGDAFSAGLVHAYLRKQSPEKMLHFANLLGAFACTHIGACPEFTRDALHHFSLRHQAHAGIDAK